MDSLVHYTSRAELYIRKDEGDLQSFLFERDYSVKYLGKRGQYATYYDPELKIHFENKSALSFVYEIEINNNNFLFSGKTEKAADFVRQVNYMFDWIQLRVSLQGKIRLIENEDEQKTRWNGIKNALLLNYEGKEINTYLTEIDSRFENEEVLHSCLKQYFNFGLLFPPIPVHHHANWQHKSLIEFSEYEGERFEEEISLLKETDNLREYKVNIHSQEGSNVEFQQYNGQIIMCKNEHLPLSAEIEVVFKKEDIANQWYFKLKRN